MFLALSLALALQEPSAPATVSRDAIQPHLAADAGGSLYCVFIEDGNIRLAVSNDRGKSFSAPVTAIDAGGKARGGMQRGPRVAVDAKKNVYVTAPLCFDPAEQGKQYPVNELWLAASSDGGKTFGKPVQVNDIPKNAPESLHWMTATPDGAVHVAWLDMRQGRGKGQFLTYAKVTDGGKKVSKNAVFAGPLCECCAPGLAVDAKGTPFLAYREGGGKSNRQIFYGTGAGKFARANQQESKVDG
jgi:hypothetical protein